MDVVICLYTLAELEVNFIGGAPRYFTEYFTIQLNKNVLSKYAESSKTDSLYYHTYIIMKYRKFNNKIIKILI